MLSQAVDRKRCASCDRWQGERRAGSDGRQVEIESELSCGLCRGGPWDNSERRARSACGHWLRWQQLPADE
ncbi:hypothetical protein VX159_07655 [Dechloromonas sp. ZY10]|uniref:hypothetical protein n=1 Tax=Dechloromonas aquae TaxID=2664436 RepID=UPI003526DEB5